MLAQVLPVSTLNAYIHQMVAADEILADIWVEGEVTRLSRPRSGHIYFTICEGDTNIDCMMWRSDAARQMFIPQQGEAIVIHGRADFYEAQGRLQIRADVFEHQGQGLLALQAERLRQQLEAEGLFDPARKRPLPRFPKRVAVVTSNTGAVWHDIQTVARRRYALVELMLVPAAVQGAHAPNQLVEAIRYAGELDAIDVMIVGRGGGSPEDLAPFNHEAVARAIYASPVPVVSAVGHETDVCIADMVADVRAATPSAAAEVVLPDIRDLLQDLSAIRTELARCASQQIADESARLGQLRQRLLLQSPNTQLARARQQLELLSRRMQAATSAELRQRDLYLRGRTQVLNALHPGNVMGRGYAMVQDGTSRAPVTLAAELPDHGQVTVSFRDDVAEGTLRQRQETASTSRAHQERES